MRIIQSARKHGITDADMIHAVENAIAIFDEEPKQDSHSAITIYVGPTHNGALVEVGVISARADGEELLIHAMPYRPHRYPIR